MFDSRWEKRIGSFNRIISSEKEKLEVDRPNLTPEQIAKREAYIAEAEGHLEHTLSIGAKPIMGEDRRN
jgi:hypothetical protein